MLTGVRFSPTVILVAFIAVLAFGQSSWAQWPDPGVPDTIEVVSDTAYTGSSAEIPIRIVNDQFLGGLEVTLTWDSPDVFVDSVSFVGSRALHLSSLGYTSLGSSVTIYAIGFTELLSAGEGLFATVHMGYTSGIQPQTVTIDSITVVQDQIEHSNIFSDINSHAFTPQFVSGTVEILESGCCIGDRGNMNGSPDDGIDIADIVYLVDFMFQGGDPSPCPQEANVDGLGDENVPDISDLVYLAAYMFSGGPPPVPCH